MAALTQARMGTVTSLTTVAFPLKAGATAYVDGMACSDTSDGSVTPGAHSSTLTPIGSFAQNIDNSAGTVSVPVLVRLTNPVNANWYDNATGANKVLAANLFGNCYVLDDHTVTLASSGNSVAGKVLGVDAVKGVLVKPPAL